MAKPNKYTRHDLYPDLVQMHTSVTQKSHDSWHEVCRDEGCSLSALLTVIDPQSLSQAVFKEARRLTHDRRSHSAIMRQKALVKARQLVEGPLRKEDEE